MPVHQAKYYVGNLHQDDLIASMKLFIQILMLLLILGLASIHLLKNPDGTPFGGRDSIMQRLNLSALLDSTASLRSATDTEIGNSQAESSMENAPAETKIYRSQDEQGGVHFSNLPPPEIEAEVVDLAPPSVLTLYRSIPETGAPSQNGNSVGAQDSQIAPLAADNAEALLPEQFSEMQETLQNAGEVSRQLQKKLQEQKQILDSL